MKGASSVRWSREELTALARKLLKAAEEEMGFIPKNGFKKGYLKDLLISGAIEHAGSGKEQDAIASRASIIQEKRITTKKEKKVDIERLAKNGQLTKELDKLGIIRKYKRNSFKIELFGKEENSEIPKKMLTYLDKVKKEHKTKKLKDHHLKAWMMFHLEGIQAAGVAKELRLSRPSILNNYRAGGYLAIVDQEIAGYMAEYAVRDLYYPKLKVIGDKQNPDLCDNIKKPTIMVEVKKRSAHETPVVDMLSSKEIEFVINGGDGHLVVVIMTGGKTVVEQYIVSIIK